MKKGIAKKLSVLSIIGVTLFSNNFFSNAYSSDLSANSEQTLEVSTDESEYLEIHNEFVKLFPEEMKMLENLRKNKKNSSKTIKELADETENMEPIIDVEKEVDGNYYRLVGYATGIFHKTGITGGTATTNSDGDVVYKGRQAYAQMFSDAINIITGHTFKATISYTKVRGGYNYITSSGVYSTYFVKDARRGTYSYKETASKKAFVNFNYSGRTSNYAGEDGSGIPGTAFYNPMQMTITIGGDSSKVTARVAHN